MKKSFLHSIFLLLVLSSTLISNAQFLGIRASNFGGINNVNYNPAIADNRYKVDINLFALDATVSNNYIGITGKLMDLKNFDGDINLSERLNGKSKTGYVSTTIQLPLSFLVAFGKESKNNQAIAFSAHLNSVTNADNLEEALGRNLRWGWGRKAFDRIGDFTSTDFHDVKDIGIKGMAWADAGVTYSRVVLDKDKHFLKVGATIKAVKGIAALYAYSDDFKYRFDNLDTISVNARMKVGASKNLEYFLPNSNFSAVDVFKGFINNQVSKWSVAADIAVVYEFRKDKEKYKYTMDCKDQYYNDRDKHFVQVGFSVINIGRLKFIKSDSVRDYDLNLQKSGEKFNANTLLYDWLNKGTRVSEDDGTFKMWLPTTINLWADLNLYKGLGVNVAAQINPIKQTKNNIHHLTTFAITPRYDYKWFGAYLPLAINQLANVQWGAGLRLGPLYIASQDIFTNLIKKDRRDVNIQVGMRVSIPNRTAKDKDKDGVSNKKDLCPTQKGTCASQGCPDRDGDGVLDIEDKCPDTPGKKELNGCPDKDGDGIIDMEDACPDQSGLKALKGCPDRDGDGVADKDDKCPDVAGKKELQGCPDTDNDGVIDSEDACPTVAGDKKHAGCPDTDGDGVYDNEDKCVNVKGPKENSGCPYPDTDGDGVLDKDDACPTVKGVKENKGCPEIKKEVQEQIKKVMLKAQSIQFETGKAVIKSISYPALDDVAKMLKEYDYYDVSIEGHTDNIGKPEMNLALSKNRAKAAYDYLINKGVDAKRLSFTGFGDTKSVEDNKTAAGRSKNRRVEFNMIMK